MTHRWTSRVSDILILQLHKCRSPVKTFPDGQERLHQSRRGMCRSRVSPNLVSSLIMVRNFARPCQRITLLLPSPTSVQGISFSPIALGVVRGFGEPHSIESSARMIAEYSSNSSFDLKLGIEPENLAKRIQ